MSSTPGLRSVEGDVKLLEQPALDRLLEGLRGARLPARRPDGLGRRDRLRRARLGSRPPGRLDGRAGRRHLPAGAPRRRGALRLRGRARTRGSGSSSRRGCALWRARRNGEARLDDRGGAARRRRRSPSSASARATSTRSRSRTGSSSAGGYVDRDYAARRERRLPRRRQLLRAGRHLLLRLDGHRARRPTPATTSR